MKLLHSGMLNHKWLILSGNILEAELFKSHAEKTSPINSLPLLLNMKVWKQQERYLICNTYG